MNFSDIFKKTVLEKFQAGELTTTSIILTIGMAIAVGLFVFFVYRINTRSGFYNKGFNKSLATLPLITAVIMLAMGSNLTISLGMVGALSIVRFRNAVKDPVDLTYLFLSISAGIVTGAGLFKLAILLCLAFAMLMMLLDLLPVLRVPCLLIVSGKDVDIEDELLSYAKEYAKTVKIRSRNIDKRGVEWIFEIQTGKEKELVKKITSMDSVNTVHLMTHDGNVRF